MPLESIFLDFVDDTFFDTHSSKSIRNLNWRLRLTQSFEHDPVLTEMWTRFFAYLSTSGPMNSDNLMAAAQVMFEIEQHTKPKPIPKKEPNYQLDLDSLTNVLDPNIGHFSESVLNEIKNMLSPLDPLTIKDIIWYGDEPPPKTIKFPSLQVFHPKKSKK